MKKILAIDDNEINLVLLNQIFKLYYPDFEFLKAKSGPEGIDIAIRKKAGNCLLDILMPGMNGYEVCKILKNETITQHIPILMISALGQNPIERTKGLKCRCGCFYFKTV